MAVQDQWRAITAGTYDADIRARATRYASFSKPMIVTFHPDPTTGVADTYGGDYCDAYVHMYDIMNNQTGLKNVVFVPLIKARLFDETNLAQDPVNWVKPAMMTRMPFLGLQVLHDGSQVTYETRVQAILDWMSSQGFPNKMIGIGSTGFSATYGGPDAATTWWANSWAWAKANTDRLGVVCYTNEVQGTVDFSLSEYPEKIAAFKDAANDPVVTFLGVAPPPPAPPPPPAGPPAQVTGVTQTAATTTSVTLQWPAPASSAPIDYYTIRRAGAVVASPTALIYTNTGLTADTAYTYTVAAHSANGDGPQSATVTARTSPATGPPTAPTNLAPNGHTATSISLSWTGATAPAGDPILDYRVYNATTNALLVTAGATARAATVTGLTAGTTYSFYVRARNNTGLSPNSNTVSDTTTATASPPPPSPPPPGTFTKQFREGSYYERALPVAAPVHPNNAQYITHITTGGAVTDPTPDMRLSGGGDTDGTGTFTPGVYEVKASDPVYHIIDETGGGLPVMWRPGGVGIRIPEVAKSYYGAAGANDAPMLVHTTAAVGPGGRDYYAWFAMLLWYPGRIPGQASDVDQTGAWVLGGTGAGAAHWFQSSYGHAGRPLRDNAMWPTTLSSGRSPDFYVDEPLNGKVSSTDTGGAAFRGFNAMCRVIHYDRLMNEGIVNYIMEVFLGPPTADAGRWPMTGYELRGGVIPEGTRLRIKPSVDVAALLNTDTAYYGTPGARTADQQTAYNQALGIARGLQTYGAIVADNAGSGTKIKVGSTTKQGRGQLWKVPTQGLRKILFAQHYEFIADFYDPITVAASPPPPPPSPPPPGGVPSAPTGLTGTAGSGSVSLNWNDNTAGTFTNYRVYNGTGTTNLLATVTVSSATINGLNNGTAYTFTVRAFLTGSGESTASNSVVLTPQAAQSPPPPPPPPPAGGFKVFTAGDVAHDLFIADAQKTSDYIVANRTAADIVVVPGDLAYSTGSIDQFNTLYHPTWGRFKGSTWPAPGNHEGTLTGYRAYWQDQSTRFPTNPASYSFVKNNWLFISLWTGANDGAFQASDYTLVDRAVSTKPAGVNGIMAYWHHPRFSSGGHGSWAGADTMVKKLYDYKFDILLTAHDHHYERFWKMDPAANNVPTTTNGFVNFVIGTGGSGARSMGATQRGSQKIIAGNARGVGVFTLGASSWSMQWVAAAGYTGSDSSGTYPINPK